ncbi:hypothetical protein SASPL_137276 [Salvia splendens]|uniref:non-specific serine/threonine protein kinase n=1 Tax=Salvia splendens TaxID=180675 RepID=A0A8X8WU25_SALSN|nr:hypothetical protein SASPL_137276 [Salvia splendens]
MSVFDAAFLNTQLSKRTSIFGLHLWVVIGIVLGAVIVLILFLLSLCITASRRRSITAKGKGKITAAAEITPVVSKEIKEIVSAAADHRPIGPQVVPEIQIDMGKVEHRVVFSDRGASSGESRATSGADTWSFGGGSGSLPEVSHLGWGRWYTLRELEAASNGLADENVIGEGGYGIVYYGVLSDNTKIAIKNLLNNKGQAEKEFKVEVDAIGRVRHKNLVRLYGYCVEGAYRMLVYEYVDNGNLDQWLHGDVGEVSPLTWDIRVNIILGTARGYVAPEYACTGMLNEKSDIYSFGILIMEVITGRTPVDYNRPQGEVNLVEWLKLMVGNRKSEEVVDPKLAEMPASKALKRLILIALKCVDPDAQKRPKMGHVIHMLESEDLLSNEEKRIARDSMSSHRGESHRGSEMTNKQSSEGTPDVSEGDSSMNNHHASTRWR